VRLILASASPRRSDLLRAAGFSFETLPVDVDERVPPGEPPATAVVRLARAKAAAAVARIGTSDAPDAVVLGADTLVAIGDRILGKPQDAAESRAMIAALAGRAHQVLTGICLRRGAHELSHAELTTVVFASMSTAEVDFYVQTGEGLDKAGAYAIQGVASRFVERLDGSYSNVVGLPVAAVYRLLRELGPQG
jgi:septum formation protein